MAEMAEMAKMTDLTDLTKMTDKEQEIVNSITERLHTMRTHALKVFEQTLDDYIAGRIKQLEFDLKYKVGKC